MLRFNEKPRTRDGETDPNNATQTRRYIAAGEFDADVVKAYAYTMTPITITTVEGILFRNKISLQSEGYCLFSVEVGYGTRKSEVGSYTFGFSTTGGTLNIKASKATVSKYPPSGPGAAPDHKQLIGVNGDDVAGADVVIPALKWSIDFRHPQGIVTIPFTKALAAVTGMVNSDDGFLDSAAGEVLYLGSSGSDGSMAEAEVKNEFAFAPNLADQVVGAITGIQQDGWDVRWIAWKSDEDGANPVKRPKHVYIERVYYRLAMAEFFGFT